jgi:two-component system, OmpR family, sensor histidine kinase BaeS
MTDKERRFGMGGLGRRLLLAFVGVVLVTVATDVAVTSIFANAEVARFVRGQQAVVANAAARAATAAYEGHGDWNRTPLHPVFNIVASTHAAVEVQDSAGAVVAVSPGFARMSAGPGFRAPVEVRGARVGSVTLRFDNKGLGTAAARLDAARWRALIMAGAIAILVAMVVSIIASRWITAPLESMLAAIWARAAGDRNLRIEDAHGVGVLGDLLATFNATSDAVDRRDQEHRNLIADLVHELRTRVAVLQAGHEAMLDGIIEPVPENLGYMRDEVLRLSRLLEDLGRLSAAEAAALQLRLGPHDLAVIAADAASSLSEVLEMTGLDLQSQLSPNIAMCDGDRMREIITNLLINAMKYTLPGGHVELETGPDDGDMARVRVSDTGVGIPPEELPRVTERFFRGRRASAMAGGSGLGLAIVEELVRAQSGHLYVTSELGNGTQVTITVPAATC